MASAYRINNRSTMNHSHALMRNRRPKGILFDMDGTLTRPRLDFEQIRRDMGITGPILEALKQMPEDQRRIKEKILHDHEDLAACESELNAGCEELLRWLDDNGIRKALVTRNTRKSVATVFDRHGLKIDVCVTREDGKYKPDPAPLFLACERLNIEPADAWMVGDGYHDIEAGRAAKIKTVWISHGLKKDFAAEPDVIVKDLIELRELLVRAESLL
jgi:HAD superfamily hydrolase (TIGR01549 family)